MKRILAALAALLLTLPPLSAPAEGALRTVTADPTEEEQLAVSSGYTGEVRITFLGDCTLGGESPPRYPTLSFEKRIQDNGTDYPFRDLVRLTAQDDLTVANLEVVLSDRKLQKVKKTFNFIGSASYTEILQKGSVECVTLANNHSHDYGSGGYADTKAALEDAGICWFDADAPAIWENSYGLKIGFLGVSGSLSGNRSSQFHRLAERLKAYGCAAVITVMHAGTEYSYDPPDGYQKQITDRAGDVTDLFIGHHPHVVQGFAVTGGVPVVYSLGNCVFGGNTQPRDFDALAVQAVLKFTDGALTGIDLHFYPLSVSSDHHYNDYSPRLLDGKDAERVLQKMYKSTGMDPGTWDAAEGAVVSLDPPARGQD